MNKIKGSYLKNLRVDEQIGVLKQIISVLKSFNVSTLELEAELARLESTTKQFEVSTSTLSEKEKTAEMVAADGEVDGFLGSFKGYLKSLSRNPKPELHVPARRLISIIEQQGWDVEDMSYEAESSVISKLNTIFTTDADAISSLKALNAEVFWSDVMVAEAKFLNIQKVRVVATSEKAGVISPITAGKDAREACYALLKKVDAFAVVSAKPEYAAIISQINEIIDAKRAQLFARTTKAENARKKAAAKNDSESAS
ncbi:DUF6261 family protein [Acetobacteroides hydrogenigenes]|uniref:Uncharacterized protein n=1 Tax=Acetobacteroides hydrogenigenes TaxID=979970 RepID=A0A4R2E587_9BACT|nr:DUF6261 family protein [Acetobacteroides hydrogenigenes]TCN63083.1 hypothetical protein CLV25_11661 [Acetobacteroides hydrogenigenes]